MAGKAFSYIRFSSREQADGDSTRRQTEMRDGYGEQHVEVDAAVVPHVLVRDDVADLPPGDHRPGLIERLVEPAPNDAAGVALGSEFKKRG